MKKKLLSILLAILMLVTFVPSMVFAEDGDLGTDTTDIVAVVPEPAFEATMVIPANVPQIDNFGVKEVGKAYVVDVKNAKDNHVVSYTASGTDFINTSDSNKKITATYYSNEAGTTAFPTDPVIVYEKKDYVENLPTMYVKIAESDWTNAAPGTYKATVTYNFKLEEVTPKQIVYISTNTTDAYNRTFASCLEDGWITFDSAQGDGIKDVINFNYVSDYEETDYYIIDRVSTNYLAGKGYKFFLVDGSYSDYEPAGGVKLDSMTAIFEYFKENYPE